MSGFIHTTGIDLIGNFMGFSQCYFDMYYDLLKHAPLTNIPLVIGQNKTKIYLQNNNNFNTILNLR